VEQQLEDRRHELTSPASTQASATAVDVHEPVGKKRRLDNGKKEAGEFGVEDSHGVPLDDVLISLKTQLANVHDARRDQQVVRNTKKALKRSRRQMELESKQQGRGRRPSSSQGQTGVTLPKTKNSTSARKPHHGSV
jgi:U3 small nucleolar RNA-associated protein 20